MKIRFKESTKLASIFSYITPLFTKFLTPGIAYELCNRVDDWLESTSPTNHIAGFIIRGLSRLLKI